MTTRIQRWGNSLAIRIPRSVADEAEMEDGTSVDLRLLRGKLVVARLPPSAPRLEDLLERVTDDNLHAEVDIGRPVGRESF